MVPDLLPPTREMEGLTAAILPDLDAVARATWRNMPEGQRIKRNPTRHPKDVGWDFVV